MPVQSNINKELDTVNKKIANFIVVKDTIGLSEETKKQLDVLMKTKSDLEKKLYRLVSVQKAQQNYKGGLINNLSFGSNLNNCCFSTAFSSNSFTIIYDKNIRSDFIVLFDIVYSTNYLL